MKIKNNEKTARAICDFLDDFPQIQPVFDLDGVIFNADHRVELFADGSIDLATYRKNSTRQQILADKLLPLASIIGYLNLKNRPYHVATARVLCDSSLELLEMHNIKPQKIISRQGEEDTRKDWLLKTDGLQEKFKPCEFESLFLIDDNQDNVTAFLRAGCLAVEVERSTKG